MVESKRHVPDLSGEDRENARALHAEEAAWKKRHESRYRGRKKAKYRHRLQDIERRENNCSCRPVLCRRIANNQRKQQRTREGDPHAQHRAPSVIRNVAQTGRKRRHVMLIEMDEHPASEMQHAPQQAKDGEQNHGIHPSERCAPFTGGGDCGGCSHRFGKKMGAAHARDSSPGLIFLSFWR